MMIAALIFDFDGLILDTEMPLYTTWRDIYAERNCELPIERWIDVLGRGSAYFDFYGHLEALSGEPVDRVALKATVSQRARAKIDVAAVRAGVIDHLDAGEQRGLAIGLASGSSLAWVSEHLQRLGLADRFEHMVTHEHTDRHKPHPDPFLRCAALLGVEPARCLVYEDSPNGIAAAKAAGMYCVAVPTEMTAPLELAEADVRVESLDALPLADLLQRLEGD